MLAFEKHILGISHQVDIQLFKEIMYMYYIFSKFQTFKMRSHRLFFMNLYQSNIIIIILLKA